MDVGEVTSPGDGDQGSWEEAEIDEVSKQTQCYRCMGYGHLAANCATVKGKGGKAPEGEGKGKTKGAARKSVSKGTGSKGKGSKGSKGKEQRKRIPGELLCLQRVRPLAVELPVVVCELRRGRGGSRRGGF